MRVPWTAMRSNQSILKKSNPEYSFEELMLKLKLQYFGHLMPRADSLEKTLMLGKIFEGRRRGRQRMRWLDGQPNGHECKQTLGDGEGQGSLVCCSPWGHKESNTTEQLNKNGNENMIENVVSCNTDHKYLSLFLFSSVLSTSSLVDRT